MSPQEINKIKNDIKYLSDLITDIEKDVKGIKIDQQGILKSNINIPPGMNCKIAYNSNGLILKGTSLESTDIPELPIDKIQGLRKTIENLSKSNNMTGVTNPVDVKTIKPGTGTKINYDENGLVTSSADLLPSDIPEVPISKVQGLMERLTLLESKESHSTVPTRDSINPGIACKISYDSDGRVVSGLKLSMEDIPVELINKINLVENKVPEVSSQLIELISTLRKETEKKVTSNNAITPGVYSKVKVDNQGLVISWDKLTIKDLPELNIRNITDLESILKNKASQTDVNELKCIVTSLSESNSIVEVEKLKTQIGNKASKSDIQSLTAQIKDLQKLLRETTNDLVLKELKELKGMVSTLDGRVNVIEQKMNINSYFSKI